MNIQGTHARSWAVVEVEAMPSAPAKSLWDAYALMLEKAPTNTVLFTGVVLILVTIVVLFLVLSVSTGLRSFLGEIIKGLRYSDGKLAYEGSSKSAETEVQTDEKGNLKLPSNANESDVQQPRAENDQFYWLFLIESACHERDDPLGKIEEYYENAQKAAGPLPASFLEATYLLGRFKCGDSSALSALRDKAGPSAASYAANGVLGRYYGDIGETEEALKCLENRFQHAPDSDHKLYSARALATFLAETERWEDGLTLLRKH